MGGYSYGGGSCNQTQNGGFGNTPPTTGNFEWQAGANYKVTIKYKAGCGGNTWCRKNFYIFVPCTIESDY